MKNKILILGLGYVGLPLAVSLSKFYNVYGFDISSSRIEELKNGIDKNKEILKKDIINKNLNFFHIENINFFVSYGPFFEIDNKVITWIEFNHCLFFKLVKKPTLSV